MAFKIVYVSSMSRDDETVDASHYTDSGGSGEWIDFTRTERRSGGPGPVTKQVLRVRAGEVARIERQD